MSVIRTAASLIRRPINYIIASGPHNKSYDLIEVQTLRESVNVFNSDGPGTRTRYRISVVSGVFIGIGARIGIGTRSKSLYRPMHH